MFRANKGLNISLNRHFKPFDFLKVFSSNSQKSLHKSNNPQMIFLAKYAIENLLRIPQEKVIANFLEHVKPSQFNLGHRFGGRESNNISCGGGKNGKNSLLFP